MIKARGNRKNDPMSDVVFDSTSGEYVTRTMQVLCYHC